MLFVKNSYQPLVRSIFNHLVLQCKGNIEGDDECSIKTQELHPGDIVNHQLDARS